LNRLAFACCRFIAPSRNRILTRSFQGCAWTSDHLADYWDTIRANQYVHCNCSLKVLLSSVRGILRSYALDTSIWPGIHAAGHSRNSSWWNKRIWEKLIRSNQLVHLNLGHCLALVHEAKKSRKYFRADRLKIAILVRRASKKRARAVVHANLR